jgi:glc operon protein GlcG
MTSNPTAPASGLPLPYGPPITLALAKLVMAAAEKEANANQWPMAIAIVDSTGHLALFQRIDQTQLGSVAVSIAKAETALNFRRPTKVFEDLMAAGGAGLRLSTMPGVAALEGGVPIVVDGHVIGAIGVSGMLSGQDAQVAAAGLAALV